MRACLVAAMVLFACAEPDEPSVETDTRTWEDVARMTDFTPGPASMRRLTRAQYVASVRAVFGDDLSVLAPNEVDTRVGGLASVGARESNVTPAGMEGYEASARGVAAAVLSDERRGRVLSCTPAETTEPDDDCASEFVRAVAPQLLRRPLRLGEEEAYAALARSATETLGGFYDGLEAITVAWLLSPEFLYIQESTAEDDRALTADAVASRLSYFLWGEGPDALLLQAAASGQLADDAGYAAEVDRLLADESKLAQGVRALFADLYELDEVLHVEKDRDAFPEWTPGAAEDAREQTLRTIVDHLLVQGADYRDLFTTRKTFMSRRLGPLYDVGVTEEWEVHEFPEGWARAGILSHVSFLASHARTSRSSPVLRGEFVLDKVLCTKLPPPPADVNFDGVADNEVNAATARERLESHLVDPTCATCHRVLDPVGLAFENFDAIGRFRTKEQGETILTYGSVQGQSYEDIRGLYTVLRDAPEVPACLVETLYAHGVGRLPVDEESELLEALTEAFGGSAYALVPLMRGIALSHGFRTTSGPAVEESP